MPKSKIRPAKKDTDPLKAHRLAQGFLPRIRQAPISKDETVAYARIDAQDGIFPITPVKKTSDRIKRPELKRDQVTPIEGVIAVTPEHKTKLIFDEVVAVTPEHKTKLTFDEVVAVTPEHKTKLTFDEVIAVTPEHKTKLTFDEVIAVTPEHKTKLIFDEVVAVTPEHKTKLTFDEVIAVTPEHKTKLTFDEVIAVTPEHKTKLTFDEVIGTFVSSDGKTREPIIRLNNKLKADFVEMEPLRKQFMHDMKVSELSQWVYPEFRGGTVLLTKEDVAYRVSKNKKTGGHRSLGAQPKQIMNGQSATEYAIELGFLSKKFTRWEWGHLLPAGGSPKGCEPNLDPYNFVAIPDTLNTWQMVPEMIARHLAELGFEIEYTALARTELIAPQGGSFLAKEIYCSLKCRHHALKAEFFTTRENHRRPLITDAAHIISEFYKVMGKPIPQDLAEKCQAEWDKILSGSTFRSPEKSVQLKPQPYAFIERPQGMAFSVEALAVVQRLDFKPVKRRRTTEAESKRQKLHRAIKK